MYMCLFLGRIVQVCNRAVWVTSLFKFVLAALLVKTEV